MKKVILVLALALMAFTAKAQFYAGGSLGITAAGGGAAINIIPEVGYSLNEDMAIGVTLGWANDGSIGWGAAASGFRLAPYFRYFLLDMGPVRFFLDGQVQLDFLSNPNQNVQVVPGVGIAPGLAIPVSDRISFAGHLGRLGYYNNAFQFLFDTNNVNVGLYYSF